MEKLTVFVLACFSILSLVACKPTTQEEDIPMRKFELNNEMQTILENEDIRDMKYIHGDVVVVYGEYVEDGEGIHVVRYDENDGIILHESYESNIVQVREEKNEALMIKSGLSQSSQIEVYAEDGTLLAEAESVYWFTNYDLRDRFDTDILLNPVDNLYYGITNEFVEPNMYNVFITQYDGSTQTNIYQTQVLPRSSMIAYESYLLTDGSLLLHYIPAENSAVSRVVQVTVDGTVLVEEDFSNDVDIELLQNGYIIHYYGIVKRYSANGSVEWEIENFYDYDGVVAEVDDTILISEGNYLYTIDSSGSIIDSIQNPTMIDRYKYTMDNGNEVHLDYNQNLVAIKDQGQILATFTVTELNDYWSHPNSITIESSETDGTHIIRLNTELEIESELVLPIEARIFQVFDNGDIVIDLEDTLEYRNSEGTVVWSWDETIYAARCYSAIEDYIVIEYYEEEQDSSSYMYSERNIAILSLEGELLTTYTFDSFTRYASYTEDSVIIYYVPDGETMDNGKIVYLKYESNKKTSYDILFHDNFQHWYIDDDMLYVVRHPLFED